MPKEPKEPGLGLEPERYLEPTPAVDSDHPEVVAFARASAGGTASAVDAAVKLFYAVRDGVRYDPYRVVMTLPAMRASVTLAQRHGWCVPKAVLLAACCRATGIPARLGYADVRNHLSTERMRRQMRSDVFYWHGYTSLWLEGRWVKATPAFNVELCEKFGLLPLDFDGRSDSIYHPFDREGRRHMEYLRERGQYADVPLDEMLATFGRRYPESRFGSAGSAELAGADFEADVARETGR
jgi:transglutaminase-like putative cysteine protease